MPLVGIAAGIQVVCYAWRRLDVLKNRQLCSKLIKCDTCICACCTCCRCLCQCSNAWVRDGCYSSYVGLSVCLCMLSMSRLWLLGEFTASSRTVSHLTFRLDIAWTLMKARCQENSHGQGSSFKSTRCSLLWQYRPLCRQSQARTLSSVLQGTLNHYLTTCDKLTKTSQTLAEWHQENCVRWIR